MSSSRMRVIGAVVVLCAAVGPGYLAGANAQTIHFICAASDPGATRLYVSLDFGAATVTSWPAGTERRLVPARPANISEDRAVWTSGPTPLAETYTLDLATGALTEVVNDRNGDARMCKKTSRVR
jgi:hypothetical protein